jgi:hypothetical protein
VDVEPAPGTGPGSDVAAAASLAVPAEPLEPFDPSEPPGISGGVRPELIEAGTGYGLNAEPGSGFGPAGGTGPVADAGLLAAPVALATAAAGDDPARLVEASLRAGGCFVRALPLDRTCAAAARRFFREAVAGLSLPGDLVHDGVTMASELAANTLHAQGNVEFSGRQRPVSGLPELWLYLRGQGARSELVCKVFDSEPGLKAGPQPGMDKQPPESIRGRGLQVVAGLSAGQWGCHPSRGRLGAWKVPGKVVWFALRIPPSAAQARSGRLQLGPERAVDELAEMLTDRGLGNRLVRADENAAGISVLSISRHLTVWRQGREVSWRAPSGEYHRTSLADLVDLAEQIVSLHEQLTLADPAGD